MVGSILFVVVLDVKSRCHVDYRWSDGFSCYSAIIVNEGVTQH